MIVENVPSAVEHDLDNSNLHPLIREALMIELLSMMPASSGLDRVDACNRFLDRISGLHLLLSRVAAVIPMMGW